MLIAGTVVADPETVVPNGAVVVEGETIAAVGDAERLREQYPDHGRHTFDLVAPGLIGGHVHSVQSLGRGIADDAALLDWLFDAVLPMEAALDGEATRAAAELGYLECLESGTTTVVDHLSVNHAEEAFEAAIETGIRARLGKVLMDKKSPEGLLEETDAALAESEALIREYHGAADGRDPVRGHAAVRRHLQRGVSPRLPRAGRPVRRRHDPHPRQRERGRDRDRRGRHGNGTCSGSTRSASPVRTSPWRTASTPTSANGRCSPRPTRSSPTVPPRI